LARFSGSPQFFAARRKTIPFPHYRQPSQHDPWNAETSSIPKLGGSPGTKLESTIRTTTQSFTTLFLATWWVGALKANWAVIRSGIERPTMRLSKTSFTAQR